LTIILATQKKKVMDPPLYTHTLKIRTNLCGVTSRWLHAVVQWR